MRRWGQEMMREGVCSRDEVGFGNVKDAPRGAVDLIVRPLAPASA